MIRQYQRRLRKRSGLTYVDVIVLLAIVGLAAMLLLPATRSGRVGARRVQCLSNMRNVALAHQNFASANKGNLPPLSSSQALKKSSGQEGEFIASWAILLLPALDNSALLKSIRENAIVESGHAKIGDETKVAVEVYGCPNDSNAYKKPGRMSFVLNAGFISRNLYHGDPDRKHLPGSLAWAGSPGDEDAIALHAATGAVWHQSDAVVSSLDYISQGDGTTTTLLLTENLQAGNWYDTDTAKIAFGYPVTNSNGKVPLGSGQTFESTENPLNTNFLGSTLRTAMPQDWAINTDRPAKPGTLPRPSSNHAGGVHVIMCDGSGKFLNENMDPHVYLKLLTSNGQKYGEEELSQASF